MDGVNKVLKLKFSGEKKKKKKSNQNISAAVGQLAHDPSQFTGVCL